MKDCFKRNLKWFVIIFFSLIVIIVGGFLILNTSASKGQISNNIEKYKYRGKDYYVYSKPYSGEYDIEYLDVFRSIKGKDEDESFKCMTYKEYADYCSSNNINQKYNDSQKNYIVYFYDTNVDDIIAELGGCDLKDDKATLYIWDENIGNTMLMVYEGNQVRVKGYAIIIPVDSKIDNYKIVPLMTRTEYNIMVGDHPLKDVEKNTKENMMKYAKEYYMSTSDEKLNSIINNCLDALAKTHTIQIDTEAIGDGIAGVEDYHLTSYLDIKDSIFKIQPGTKSIQYYVYADNTFVSYTSYGSEEGEEDFSYYTHHSDRGRMFPCIFSAFGGYFLYDTDEYNYYVTENENQYVVRTEGKTEENEDETCEYYINKKTYLIDKVIKYDPSFRDRESIYSYTNKTVTLSENVYKNTEEAVFDKPILYLYPEEETDLEIKLESSQNIIVSYPEYQDGWEVTAYPDGSILDKNTNKKYYALYWESKTDYKVNRETGFVVKSSELVDFFEEKLKILGLNDREINEFIIYWLPILKDNEYSLIHFLTYEEINESMPISFSVEPDTIIRVYMQAEKVDPNTHIEEQKLESITRKGFTAVEWGGCLIEK